MGVVHKTVFIFNLILLIYIPTDIIYTRNNYLYNIMFIEIYLIFILRKNDKQFRQLLQLLGKQWQVFVYTSRRGGMLYVVSVYACLWVFMLNA